MRFDSKEDAAEDLVAKFYQPEIVELLWDFGVSITIDDQQGPLLNAIVTQVDGYDLLLSQQVAQFGYELACIDWNKVGTFWIAFNYIVLAGTCWKTDCTNGCPTSHSISNCSLHRDGGQRTVRNDQRPFDAVFEDRFLCARKARASLHKTVINRRCI